MKKLQLNPITGLEEQRKKRNNKKKDNLPSLLY
jgi:hypothetical protein